MIEFAKLTVGETCFFRMPESRKPYRVMILAVCEVFVQTVGGGKRVDVSSELLKNLNPKEVTDANVRVRFTNESEEVVSMRYLFLLWEEALKLGPIRPSRSPYSPGPTDPNLIDRVVSRNL